MAVIPFYGATRPDLFVIEREAMDRAGLVIDALDARLPPHGLVADIGAGDGFTAMRLRSPGRTVVAVEPAPGMVRPGRPLPWVGAEAERLPFPDGVFDGAYATQFDDLDEARRLLGFWSGARGEDAAARRVTFRAGLFAEVGRGPGGR